MASTPQAVAISELSPSDDAVKQAALGRLAWSVLGYTVLVILFGAVVRITGSGAGCGQHWPTCQGEVVHLPKTMATAIELSHRLTSGLALLLVVGVAVAAFRRFPVRHPTRRTAVAAVVFMFSESLVGAALVLLRLVGENASVARAGVMAVHLVNTSFLVAAIALTAWTATHAAPRRWRPICPLEWSILGALGTVLVVSITGAVTALGDTLYPVEASRTLVARLAADQATTATFLEHGRAVHPLVAFTAAVFVLAVAWKTPEKRPRPEVEAGSRVVIGLVFAQVGAGVLNVLLSAPGWMQVVHLALATFVWIALVLFYATTISARTLSP